MVLAGIDPGLDGAIALFHSEWIIGHAVEVYDTPTLTIGGRKGSQKRQYNAPLMMELLTGVSFVVLESVHSMPGQGVRSMFSMGYGLGVWVGLLTGLRIPYELVSPQRWKAAMMDGQGKDKDASRFRAMAIFPDVADRLQRKRDDGRADALLILEYGRRMGFRDGPAVRDLPTVTAAHDVTHDRISVTTSTV